MRAFNARFVPREKFGATYPVLGCLLFGFLLCIFSIPNLTAGKNYAVGVVVLVLGIGLFVAAFQLHKRAKYARISALMFTGSNDRRSQTQELISG